jgi:hypothetical protein
MQRLEEKTGAILSKYEPHRSTHSLGPVRLLDTEKHWTHLGKPARIDSSNALHELFRGKNELVVNNVLWGI